MTPGGNPIWAYICDCDCGNQHRVATHNLKTTQSCGCHRSSSKSERLGREGIAVGQRSHRLKAIAKVQRRTEAGKPVRMVKCLCDCGKMTETREDNFINGTVKSCGCLRSELATTRSKEHGQYNTFNYHLWQAVKDRATNPKNPHYARLDVPLHGPWQRDFKRFAAYIEKHLGPKPTARHSLDRISVDKGYVPGNLRWASPTEQQRNKANNHRITANGETLCVTEWAERLGVSHSTILNRINLGWSEEQAVTTPPRPKKKAMGKRRNRRTA
jgi:hypothetical protein